MSDQRQSISERATASVKSFAPDRRNRDHLREVWRLTADDWSGKKNRAEILEEGRKMILDEIMLEFLDAKVPAYKARAMARTSRRYRDYCRTLYDAKKDADDAWNAMRFAERDYWANNNDEANERSERRMSG